MGFKHSKPDLGDTDSAVLAAIL